MMPAGLRAESFVHYPPLARVQAAKYLPVLRHIPLPQLPLFLSQLINYDWLFPPEQRDVTGQLDYLGSLADSNFDVLMAPFAAIRLPVQIEDIDWVNQPRHFDEQLSAFLWSVHQIDTYHAAVREYQQHLKSRTEQPPAATRLTMVIIGAGVKERKITPFRRLRPEGTLFTAVDPTSGVETFLGTLTARARQYPGAYAHWYIDGGDPKPIAAEGISAISYGKLAPAVRKELAFLSGFVTHPASWGPTSVEAMTSHMADIGPTDLGLDESTGSPVLQYFALDVLTQGAGTQVYSTTFVQWAARECLHRAQPLTLVARFRPRQEAATMNELLARDPFTQTLDAEGALVDADMGAYYTWINQNRLPGADQSRFLAWFEDHNTAVAIGPTMARGATSETAANLEKNLGWMA